MFERTSIVLGTLATTVAMSVGLFAAPAANGMEMKPNGCKGPSLCHTRPDIDSRDLFIDIGFILEQVRMTGTEYGYALNGLPLSDLTDATTTPINTYPQAAKGLRPNFKLDWGVTVGLGRHFEHDDWDVNVQFDWLSSTGKKSYDANFSTTLIPVGVDVNLPTGTDVTDANQYMPIYQAMVSKASYEVNYYMVDAVLGRGNYFSGCVAFTPFFGFKFALIQNHNTIKFTDDQDNEDEVYFIGLSEYIIKQREQFWGIGPEFGMDTVWGLGDGFSFFFDNSIALLLGYSKINDQQYILDAFPDVVPTISGPSGTSSISYRENAINMIAPTVKSFIGVQYEKCVYYGQQYIRIRAGWDNAFYWNQYQHSTIFNEDYNIGGNVADGLFGSTNKNTGSASVFRVSQNNSFALTGLRIDLNWDF